MTSLTLSRQVRWRPRGVGRKGQLETKEPSEECRSGTSEWVEGVPVTESNDKTGGQLRPQTIGVRKIAVEATGGWEVTGSGGQAGEDTKNVIKGTTEPFGDVEGFVSFLIFVLHCYTIHSSLESYIC
jgi:hypothetical protein